MSQEKLVDKEISVKIKLSKPYSKGAYNVVNYDEQWIRISEGCPNNCEYCAETKENGRDPIYFEIPEIVRNDVKILDMNLIYKPKALQIINELGSKRVNDKNVHYELVCGIDHRYMTQEIADALKKNRFDKIRLAWDYGFSSQKKIKSVVDMLKKAGYGKKEIMIFMICNWKTTYVDNLMKLDLCKVWNVQVSDCWFDNQTFPDVKPIYWTIEQCKDFRRRCRKHNQLINYGIDPEVK